MHVCPLQYCSRTLPATQFKSDLLGDKLSEVQMSYFYLCLSVCQYLWIIKFLEWAYRNKWGGGGIWGGIFIDWDIEGSFFVWFYYVFVCILHKFAYSQIIQDGLEFQILGTIWLLDFPDLSRLIPMLLFSCSVDWKLRWLSFLSVLSVSVDFPFWMRLGVWYHCYYLYSVVLFFPRYTGVKKTQHYKLFISNPIVLFWRNKKKNQQQHNRTYSERPLYRRTSGKNNACKN